MKLLGEGGIRPLEAGRCTFWEVWQFVEIEGKRRQKSRRVHGGKREAQKALLTLRDELSDKVAQFGKFRVLRGTLGILAGIKRRVFPWHNTQRPLTYKRA